MTAMLLDIGALKLISAILSPIAIVLMWIVVWRNTRGKERFFMCLIFLCLTAIVFTSVSIRFGYVFVSGNKLMLYFIILNLVLSIIFLLIFLIIYIFVIKYKIREP